MLHKVYEYLIGRYIPRHLNPYPPRWLRDLFEDADRNGDGTLDLKEVIAMLRRLNVGVSKKVIKQKFKVHTSVCACISMWNIIT